jgi:cold shock CspA family protein
MGESQKAGDERLGIVEANMDNNMRIGTIEMFNPRKLWGFIQENSGERWFFHQDNCVSGFHPQLGSVVEFEIGPAISLGKRDMAVNVRAVGGSN